MFIQDHGTVTSRIVTEMAQGETMTAMTEEETATGIDMMTGTAETMTEEVCYSACALLRPGYEHFHFQLINSFPALMSFQALTPVVAEEVVGPLAAATAATMMTVGVAVIVMGTGTVTVSVKTGMKDGTIGVKKGVRMH